MEHWGGNTPQEHRVIQSFNIHYLQICEVWPGRVRGRVGVGEVRVRGGRVGTVGDGNFVVHCPSPIIPISLYQIFFCEKDNVAPHNYPSHHITTDPRILHPTPEQWAGVSGGSGEAVK